jgi:hypothetical protein
MDITTKIRNASPVLAVLQPGSVDIYCFSCQVGELAVLDAGADFTRNCFQQNIAPLFSAYLHSPGPTTLTAPISSSGPSIYKILLFYTIIAIDTIICLLSHISERQGIM